LEPSSSSQEEVVVHHQGEEAVHHQEEEAVHHQGEEVVLEGVVHQEEGEGEGHQEVGEDREEEVALVAVGLLAVVEGLVELELLEVMERQEEEGVQQVQARQEEGVLTVATDLSTSECWIFVLFNCSNLLSCYATCNDLGRTLF
jgi:hypothetical protein